MANFNFKDHYATLGIDPKGEPTKVTPEQIREAFLERAKETHPDSRLDRDKSANANEEFRAVREAYDVLQSSEGKPEYDALWLSQHQRRQRTAGTGRTSGPGPGSQRNFPTLEQWNAFEQLIRHRYGVSVEDVVRRYGSGGSGPRSEEGSASPYSSSQTGQVGGKNLTMTFDKIGKVSVEIRSLPYSFRGHPLEALILGISSDDKVYFAGERAEVVNMGGNLFIESGEGGKLLLPISNTGLEVIIDSISPVKGNIAHGGRIRAASINLCVRSPLTITTDSHISLKGMVRETTPGPSGFGYIPSRVYGFDYTRKRLSLNSDSTIKVEYEPMVR